MELWPSSPSLPCGTLPWGGGEWGRSKQDPWLIPNLWSPLTNTWPHLSPLSSMKCQLPRLASLTHTLKAEWAAKGCGWRKDCRISSFCHDHHLVFLVANPLGPLHQAFDCLSRVPSDPRLPTQWRPFTQLTALGFWRHSVRLPGFCCWLFADFHDVIEPHFFQWLFKHMLTICKGQEPGK